MSRLEWLLALDERNNMGRRWFSKKLHIFARPRLPRTGITIDDAKLIVSKALNPRSWTKTAREGVVKYAAGRNQQKGGRKVNSLQEGKVS